MLKTTDLKKLIVIEEQEVYSDNIGGYKQNWFSKFVVWAQCKPLYNKKQFGHEIAISKQLNSVNYYEFCIRYRDGITNKMRIRSDKKIFNIIKVVDFDPEKKFIELIAQEII